MTHDEPSLSTVLRASPEAVLAAALGSMGSTLDDWRVDAVHARPGAETSVAYDVVASGERRYVVATTADIEESARIASAAVRLDGEHGSVTVWLHPADPRLLGLPWACVPEALEARIATAEGTDAHVFGLEMLVLRPMRRAVIRVELSLGGTHTVRFVKVVRPSRAAALLERHRLCKLAPRALDLGDGVVLIDAAEGMPLTSHLFRPTAPKGRTPLEPERLLEVLDALPAEAVTLSRRSSPTDEVRRYAIAATTAGLDADRVERLAATIEQLTRDAPGPIVATHGDFHAANIFVTEEAVPEPVALIDVDTLGPGYRVDDLACLLAHLLTLVDFDAAGYADVPNWIERVRAAFSRDQSYEQLPARTAAVLLSLASGIGDPERAEAWLVRAESEIFTPPAR